MASRKSSYKEQEKDGDKCGQCSKVVGSKDNGIGCDICERWFHAACVDMSEEVYKVACQSELLHWFCGSCNAAALKTLKAVSRLHDKVEKIEERMANMQRDTEKAMQEFKGSIATVEVQLNKQTADFNDVKAVVDAQMTKNSTEISRLMAKVNEISN